MPFCGTGIVIYIGVSGSIVLYKFECDKVKGNEILIGGHCMLTSLTSTDDPRMSDDLPCSRMRPTMWESFASRAEL